MPHDHANGPKVHTVDLLEQGITVLEKIGYEVRLESELGRSMVCRVKGKSILVLDAGETSREQLDVVLRALRSETSVAMLAQCSMELRSVLELQKRAA
jgi:hypothetical protein